MSLAFLDSNDCNLQLWHGERHIQSPGYALLEGRDYRFGNPARESARLHPRNINTRYWWQLSTEALQPALGPARHTADLVHAHLLQLHKEAGEPGEYLLAAPGNMRREQLSLLLGIVQQCPFDVVGLVNRSVLLGSLHGGPGRLFHLELQLHLALLSEMNQEGSEIQLVRTVPLPGCGLLQLQERLVEIIAAAFIRQTRFDPRRKAQTEQQLYDALPTALATLNQSVETNLDVNGYQARINRGDLAQAAEQLLTAAREAIGEAQEGDHLIADPLLALLPGLGDGLQGLEILRADALQQALGQHQSRLVRRGEALTFTAALPCLHTRSAPAERAAPVQAREELITAPTHLLYSGTARALGSSPIALAEGWELFPTDKGWQLRGSGAGLTVGGSEYRPGQLLQAGDDIHIAGGREWQLIEVLPG